MTIEDSVVVARDGAVGWVMLNRPNKRNALNIEMRLAISVAVKALTADKDIRVIVISGGDQVFAAGADLNMLVDKGSQAVLDLDLGQYWAPVAQCPKPVIAAVCGFALGAGSELALMCDIIVADATACFGQPECTVGIMPGAGGSQRLVRAVGRPVASLMLMTGDTLSGERAYQLGLVSELAAPGQVLNRAGELALRIATMPPKAIAAIKRVLKDGPDLPLHHALVIENREFALLFDTADKTEGMRAFLERRKPVFNGQ